MVLLLKLCVWFMKLVHRISLEETLLFIFPPDFIISTGVFVESEFVVVNSFDFSLINCHRYILLSLTFVYK